MRHHDLTRPTLAILAGSLAALFGTLALRILLARALTPAELGVLFTAIAIVSWAGGVGSLGLCGAITHRVADLLARHEDSLARQTARTGVILAAVSGTVAAAGVVVVGLVAPDWLIPPVVAALLPALAPTALGLAVGLAAVGVSRAFGDVAARSIIRDSGGGALRLAAVAAMLALHPTLGAMALAYALASLTAEVATVGFVASRGWFAGAAGRDRELGRAARPFTWLEVLNQSQQWADMVLVGALAPPAEAGYYVVARGLSRALLMVQSSVAHAFLPAATEAWRSHGSAGLRTVYGRARSLLVALLLPALAVGIASPHLPVAILFGPTYAAAEPALRILALALLIETIVGGKQIALVASNQAAAAARAGTWAFAATVAVLALLTGRFGAVGAATAVAAAALVRATLATAALRRRGGLSWRDDLPLPVVAGLTVTAATAALASLFDVDQFARGLAVALIAAGAGWFIYRRGEPRKQ